MRCRLSPTADVPSHTSGAAQMRSNADHPPLILTITAVFRTKVGCELFELRAVLLCWRSFSNRSFLAIDQILPVGQYTIARSLPSLDTS